MRPSARRGAPSCKGCLGLLVGRRVQRSRLLPRQLQAAQDPRERLAGRSRSSRRRSIQRHGIGRVRPEPPSSARSGPRKTAFRSDACSASASTGARPALGRSRRPSSPSPSQRTTASRSACRSMPASRAASARLMPSGAPAMAGMRDAARGFRSRRASRRSQAGLARSVRISGAAPIGLSASSHAKRIAPAVAAGSKASQNLSAAVSDHSLRQAAKNVTYLVTPVVAGLV